jgi:Fur family ferric uptake transcriptional regulator
MSNINHEKILKKHGLRITQTRLDVLGLFLSEEAAVSNQYIEKALDRIDRITLYRTLKSFESKGLIHKAVDGTEVPKYAMCMENCTEENHQHHHVHFHCEKCENTFCIENILIPVIKTPKGYTINSTDVILSGLCDNCN